VPPLLHAWQQQRLNGWIAMLDVDLELAQAALRLPAHELPMPPLALPETRVDPWSSDVAPAVEAPTAEEAAQPVRLAPKRELVGAYARRARKAGAS
jgi:hypothetical protein